MGFCRVEAVLGRRKELEPQPCVMLLALARDRVT